LEWPQVDPAGAASRLIGEAARGEVALVLGRESSGLSNDELALCHFLVHIPTNPDFSSLNVAAAAQVFAYEIRRTLLARENARPDLVPGLDDRPELATAEEMDGFHDHLMRTLIAIDYADPDQCTTLSRRLRRLFHRARPDRTELNILRGVLAKMAAYRLACLLGRPLCRANPCIERLCGSWRFAKANENPARCRREQGLVFCIKSFRRAKDKT
jgi:tRNA (cytidine32/uridine32-2'-O)-methyltransferase